MPYNPNYPVPQYYPPPQNGNTNGQARPSGARLPQQMPYQPAAQGQNFPQYTTPQQNIRGRPSFYQTPQYQQPYLSPPTPQTGLRQAQRYSPDPLQYYQQYQQPPRPRQASPQGYHQQQRQQVPYQSSQTPQAPVRQPGPQPQWTNLPQSTYEAPRQHNTGSISGSQQNPPPQQRPQQQQWAQCQVSQPQRPPSQSSQYRPQIPTEARRPSPIQMQGQNQTQRHCQNQQQVSAGQARSTPISQPTQAPQRDTTQINRTPSLSRPPHPPASSLSANAHIGPSSTTMKAVQPVQRVPPPDQIKYDEPMAPSAKRRRSNEGVAIPACETTPVPRQNTNDHHIEQKSQRPQHHITQPRQQPPSSSPLTQSRPSQVPSTPTPGASLNYHSILLSLSDEYVQAAYSMSASLAGADVSEEAVEEYQNLLATGMGCLETVLKNYAIPDKRKEARVRLRLATLLFEETDNDREAEETLSKGIPACERARLSDLKYAMHHLLARISFQGGKYKAAMTAVDKLVIETEKLQLFHWVYAFRFLRVSFGLLVPEGQRETAAMVKNLTAIAQIASRKYHFAVEIVASTLEALVHLKSRHVDSVDMTMRAVAAARTHQLTPAMTKMPQIRALLDCIDLACTLARFNHERSQIKLQEMQTNMDTITRDPNWATDGALHVPLGVQKDVDMNAETGGVMRQTREGEVTLYFSWLTQTQVYSFGFLLSGLSVMNKTSGNEAKAEMFLGEGIKLSKLHLELGPQSLSAACDKYHNQLQLRIMLRLYIVFACCGRSDWEVATTKGLEALRRDLAEFRSKPDQHLTTLLAYLEALCKHGLGDLQGALQIYRSADLYFVPESDTKPGAVNIDPIKVLATLNSILIMRGLGQDDEADQLLQGLQPHCVVITNSIGNEHGSKAMEAAFYLLQATSASQKAEDSTILTTKKFLQAAVVAAKTVSNSQLLCIVMNIMTDAFFHNIIGEQAEKSAKAGRTLALKSQDKLWTAVADGMYADTLEKCGKKPEASHMRREAQKSLQSLPQALKAALPSESMNC